MAAQVNGTSTPPTTGTATTSDLVTIAASLGTGIQIPAKDLPHYLSLLNASETAFLTIAGLPEYADPRLKPVDGLNEEEKRAYRRLEKEKNPLGAWSHHAEFQTSSRTALESGPLAGRTLVLKDNISVGHVPLTCGTFPQFISPDSKYPISKIDAPVVSRILQAGGLIKGTATCENYSMCALSYSSATGPVENAWLKGYTTGGSSSGCTALVGIQKVKEWRAKRGLPVDEALLGEGVDMAVGGDQGGSIRLPAAYGGVYGLKPTYGLIPYTGIAGLHPMVDSTGPICGSVKDVAILLGVLAGYDGFDPRMGPESPLRKDVKDYAGILEEVVKGKEAKGEWIVGSAGKGLRVGVIKEAFEIAALVPEVKDVVRKAAKQFEAVGATVEEVSIPLHALGPAIWVAATRCSFADYATKNLPTPILSYPLPDLQMSPPTQEMYDLLSRHNPAVVNALFGTKYLADKYPPSMTAKAHMHVHELRAAYDAALENYDVLITPVNPTVAMRHPEDSNDILTRINIAVGNTANTTPFNISGHPGLSIPVGWGKVEDGEEKLPVGMQIIGRRFDEESVLKAAMIWEVGGLGLDKE